MQTKINKPRQISQTTIYNPRVIFEALNSNLSAREMEAINSDSLDQTLVRRLF